MDTLLYVENLTVSFDGFLALRNLNLIVERTERVRLLIGPNGAGKTTLFDVLTGHVAPSAGRVLFRDTVNLAAMSPHAIANVGVIRKFQTPSVFPGHTVFEKMLLVDDPTLLLLDEPAAGMTRPEKERTIALIEGIVARSSSCVMLIEHDMEFVRQVARRGHRVTVLHEGTVLSEGSLDRVQADERVIEAYLGRGKVRGA